MLDPEATVAGGGSISRVSGRSSAAETGSRVTRIVGPRQPRCGVRSHDERCGCDTRQRLNPRHGAPGPPEVSGICDPGSPIARLKRSEAIHQAVGDSRWRPARRERGPARRRPVVESGAVAMIKPSEPLVDADAHAGVLSRDPFVAELERAVGRARAAGTPTSLVVVRSADHPKSAAHHWAALVLGLVRPGDRVGALGPSELVVLLEGASREAAGEIALLIVTHDLAVARLLAHRLMVMKAGRVVETGLTDQVLDDPQHPYTQLLVSSVLQP